MGKVTIGRQTLDNTVTLCKRNCAAQVHAFGQIRCRGWSITARRDTTAQSTGSVLVLPQEEASSLWVTAVLAFNVDGCVAGVAL